jgi:hypothetical protein
MIFTQRQNPIAAQSRGVARIKNGKAETIKTSQAAVCAEPKVTVARLQYLDIVLWQPVFGGLNIMQVITCARLRGHEQVPTAEQQDAD